MYSYWQPVFHPVEETMTEMIMVKELSKSFGEIRAVRGIDFTVERGEIFGFLGPNGAGKTTTISMLSGLLRPDSGSITIDGMDMASRGRDIRRIMGVIPQEIALYEELSGRDNLLFWGGLYGLSGGELKNSVDRALELVDLVDRSKDAVRTYSGGMKRRINLCAGLVHDPKIILLDEPTLGIDPQARIRILEVVKRLAGEGKTVIYTTHYLEEAEHLCDRISIIDEGTIYASGTLAELVELVGGKILVSITGDFGADEAKQVIGDAEFDHLSDGELRVKLLDRDSTGRLLGGLFSAGLHVDEVAIREPSLESVFLQVTGRELRD
jgi:ABC-2 type transport system ATP-binding protein